MYKLPEAVCSFLTNINSICLDMLKNLEIENAHSVQTVVIENIDDPVNAKFVIRYALGFPDEEEPYIMDQVVEIYVEDLVKENFALRHYERLKQQYYNAYKKRMEKERKEAEAQREKECEEATSVFTKEFNKEE